MKPRLSRNSAVLVLIAVMGAAAFLIGGAVTVVTTGDTEAVKGAVAQLVDLRTVVDDLSEAGHDQEASLGDYVLSTQIAARQRFDEAVAAELVATQALRAATIDLPDVRVAVEARIEAGLAWRERVATQAINAVQRGDGLAMERYAQQSAADHVAIDAAALALERALIVVDTALAGRQAMVANATVIGISIAFGSLVLAFSGALIAVRRFGQALEHDARQAGVLNRFTEVTSFAGDDHEVAIANLVALRRLVEPDASVMHILNRSMDRAVPEASTGAAIAEVLPLRALERCAGVLRGTMYVSDDLADDLSVRCPVYPVTTGTLACVPLTSGESVGAIHLYWARADALPWSDRSAVSRLTEHAALAIGNRRLLAALHGQANTDGRTGLANSRAFDLAVEAALAARSGDEFLSILMIDVDHFKAFNDRHGHPAGDEALKAFAGVLRSCMRDRDVAARYGGEEFAVLLRGEDATVANAVAERIRTRTEAMIIALAPGLTDRITVSIGIAVAPDQAQDRVSLLRLADEALYRAKETGRNRVAA